MCNDRYTWISSYLTFEKLTIHFWYNWAKCCEKRFETYFCERKSYFWRQFYLRLFMWLQWTKDQLIQVISRYWADEMSLSDPNLKWSSFKSTQPTTTKSCIRHDSYARLAPSSTPDTPTLFDSTFRIFILLKYYNSTPCCLVWVIWIYCD